MFRAGQLAEKRIPTQRTSKGEKKKKTGRVEVEDSYRLPWEACRISQAVAALAKEINYSIGIYDYGSSQIRKAL